MRLYVVTGLFLEAAVLASTSRERDLDLQLLSPGSLILSSLRGCRPSVATRRGIAPFMWALVWQLERHEGTVFGMTLQIMRGLKNEFDS